MSDQHTNKVDSNIEKLNLFSLKKVFKGATVYSLGEVLVNASGFFLIPLYTRLLTPADYGIVGYLQVFLQVATVVVAFGFNAAQARYYFENYADTEAMGRFAFTINLVTVTIAIIIGVPLTFLGIHFSWTLGLAHIPFWPYMVLTIWTVVLQVLVNNALSWYRAKQQFVVTSFLQITRFLLITGATLLFILVYDLKALGRVAGIFAGMSIFFVVSFVGYARKFKWKLSHEALRYAIIFGAPIVVHLLAGTIHNMIDRIILARFVSLDGLGIYTIAFTIGNALNIFIMGFNQAFQPSYFQLMSSSGEDKKYQIIRSFKLWLLIVTIIALVGILLGGPFLRIFAGPSFIATIQIFPWIILSVFMGGFYFFFSAPIFYFKKTKYLPLITGLSAVVNILLNLIFIPAWGLIGAAIATVISHIIQSIAALIIGNHLFSMKWPMGWIFISSGVIVLSTFLVWVLQ